MKPLLTLARPYPRSAGDLIHDVRFGVPASTVMSYRAFKQAWTGYPTTVPDFTVVANGTTNAYASWNGATEVATWSLMGGSSSTALSSISNVTRSGFETTIPVDGTYAYLAAAALSADVSPSALTAIFRDLVLIFSPFVGYLPWRHQRLLRFRLGVYKHGWVLPQRRRCDHSQYHLFGNVCQYFKLRGHQRGFNPFRLCLHSACCWSPRSSDNLRDERQWWRV